MKGAGRMAVLVRLAKLEEDRALQALGAALREQRTHEAASAHAARGAEEADRIQTFGSGAIAAEWATQAFRHAHFARERAAAARLELLHANEKLETARDALARAKLRVRAMEKVRDRRERAQARKRQRAQDARLDDAVASQQLRRQARNG